MKRLIFSIMICLPALVFAQSYSRPGEIIVQLEPDISIPDFLLSVDIPGHPAPFLQFKKIISAPQHLYLFTYNDEPNTKLDDEVLSSLAHHFYVQAVQVNYILEPRSSGMLLPDEPFFSLANDEIQAGAARNVSSGKVTALGDTIVVALIDGGLDQAHTGIQSNIWKNHAEIPDNGIDDDNNGLIDDYRGFNFKDETGKLSVDNHGTSVASIIGSKGSDESTGTGVNNDIQLMALQVDNDLATVLAASCYVLNMRKLYNHTQGAQGAFVVALNQSFGITTNRKEPASAWNNICDSLGLAGILTVSATANEPINVDQFGDLPTGLSSDYLITVTGMDGNFLDPNAGFGKQSIDIAAPSKGILAAINNNEYALADGTSAAAALVTGAISLLYTASCDELAKLSIDHPELATVVIKNLIFQGVDLKSDLIGKVASGGRLNVYKSMVLAEELGNCKVAIIEEGEDANADETGFLGIYPNPATAIINITYENKRIGNNLFVISNSLGEKVMEVVDFVKSAGSHSAQIDISGLSAGIYYIYMATGYQQSEMHKFVVY